MIITFMTSADLPHVDRIQRQAYKADLVESIEALASRLRMAPKFAFVARDGGDCLGYLLAHPWPADQSPGLQNSLEILPENCDALHLHDMAVDPAHAGRGIGRALLGALTEAARAAGFSQITLVAVQGADTFWNKMGFLAVRRVDGYDDGALLMRRILEE